MYGICIILFIVNIFEGIVITCILKNRDKTSIKNRLRFFRSFWGNFVVYVLATSIIGLFLGSIYFKQIIGLDEINSWVSIVLGLIALVIGIISLFLSFYNVDQAIESQKQSMSIMQEVKKEIQEKMNILDSHMREGFNELQSDIKYNGIHNDTIKPEEVNSSDWGVM